MKNLLDELKNLTLKMDHKAFGFFLVISILLSANLFAADEKSDKTQLSEEDDFSTTPFTEYGEFNEEDEEASDTHYFQTGRFFGVSFGLGGQLAGGNRGILFKGGFPLLDFRLHYWFNFQTALNLNIYSVSHFYDLNDGDHKTVQMVHLGPSIKYYFDVRNLASTITFANPHLIAGFGIYSKGETSTKNDPQATENPVGFNFGAGFEFPVQHRSLYLGLEARAHFVTYKDTNSAIYSDTTKQPDLTGPFYTGVLSMIFTW